MSDTYILKKDHLTPFLRKLKKQNRLIAPVKNSHGDTIFSELSSVDNVQIDLDNQPQNSLKQYFLPQQEVLFSYKAPSATDYEFKPIKASCPSTLYFGVRPCDLAAILYMDVIFLKESKDPTYQQRRRNSVLIGLNCNTPFTNCFCNATRSGPFIDFGYDLQFTDLGDRFLVQVDRAAGQEIVDTLPQFFSPAAEDDVKKQYQLFLEARGGFTTQVHVDLATKKLSEGAVSSEVWLELSSRCQDCGGCAYICPTCTCFTIYDQPISDNEGERIRSWDACTFSGFTLMAGGHNPIDRTCQAIEQRFRHKLQYDAQQHGRPSCVGCGRCVGICFGGTDIVRFVNMVSCEEMI